MNTNFSNVMAAPKIVKNGENGFTCFWRIEHFTLWKANPDLVIKSQIFLVKMLRDSKWHLEFRQYRNGFLEVSLFKDANPGNTNISFSFSLLKNTGWTKLSNNSRCRFSTDGVGWGSEIFSDWTRLLKQKHVFLPDGALTLCIRMGNGSTSNKSAQCLMTSRMISDRDVIHLPMTEHKTLNPSSFLVNLTSKNILKESVKAKKVCDKSTQTCATEDNNIFRDTEDLLHLFRENKFSYVTLRTANRDFHVHKALLCARSSVFRAMFERNLKENVTNHVDIHDVDGGTLSCLLQFLHLEPLEDLKWEASVKLYYAAEKYQIEQLKNKCSLLLQKSISVQNVCHALILSDMHQDEDLKLCVQEYFCKNSKNILRSKEWNDLLLNRTKLAAEILQVLS